MRTFNEYQSAAIRTPACPDCRGEVRFPLLGLQEEAGKIGRLLRQEGESVSLRLNPAQSAELNERLGDMLWYMAHLCQAAGIQLQDVADRSLAELAKRSKELGSS